MTTTHACSHLLSFQLEPITAEGEMTDSDASVEQTVKVDEPAHIKWGLQAIHL